MIKKLIAFLLCCSISLWAQINVRDFGAAGDGKQDDTIAIQKAIAAAGKQVKYQRFHLERGWYSGTTSMAVPEVFFPAGNYKISKTLVVKGPVALRGRNSERSGTGYPLLRHFPHDIYQESSIRRRFCSVALFRA